jgi:DNA-binding CsgD family transcriptional regulator
MGASELSAKRAAYVADGGSSEKSQRGPGGPRRITGPDGAEREVAAHIALAETLVAWDRFESGSSRLLAELAETLGCEVGVLWVPRGDRLRPRAFWQADPADPGQLKTMTLTSRLPRGVELPGRAWQRAEPTAQSDAEELGPRWRTAVAAGFREAVAFPAVWEDEVIAVIELVSREQLEFTERLKRSLTAIGYVLGHFFAHRRGILDDRVITDRQIEILRLAAQGLSGRQIAEQLVVSPSTVKTHFENSYARLGVRNRSAAVAEAIRLGLVD